MRDARYVALTGLLCLGLALTAKPGLGQGLHAWVKAGGGYDNNVNSAPDEPLINLPDLAGQTGTFISSTEHGYFGDLGAGLSWSTLVTPNWQVLAGGKTLGKHYYGVDDSNAVGSDIRSRIYFGARGHYGKHRIGLTALLRNRYRDGSTYNNAGGLYAHYSYSASPTLRFGSFLLYRRYDYQFDTQGELEAKTYNTDAFSGGVSIKKAVLDKRLVLQGGSYVGRSHKLHHDAPDFLDSDIVGLYVKGTWHWNKRFQTRLTLLGNKVSHDGHSAYFPDRKRKDKRGIAELSALYRLGAGFSISPKLTYIHNNSNIPMRDYDRTIISLQLRKQLF